MPSVTTTATTMSPAMTPRPGAANAVVPERFRATKNFPHIVHLSNTTMTIDTHFFERSGYQVGIYSSVEDAGKRARCSGILRYQLNRWRWSLT